NNFDNILSITEFIKKLETLKYKIELSDNNINGEIEKFINKTVINIELNIYINICGKRHSIIKIERLSDEITQIDFCFSEDEINGRHMKKLKRLLNDLVIEFNGIVGMIGWETVCNMIFFETENAYPHKDYTMGNLKYYTNKDINIDTEKWLNGVYEIIWNKKYKNDVRPYIA
ncbi:MAG: hypothetical protein LBL44_03775, partial [Treponema sp.]|nr:hypothetical protein [Treponema sp.]